MEYETLQRQFDPQTYDPEQWVLLAKEAGMKATTARAFEVVLE